jgi:hypothetical protein
MECSGSDLLVISYSGADADDRDAEYSCEVRTGLEMSLVFNSIRPGTLRLRVEALSEDGPSSVNGTLGLLRRPRNPKPRDRTGILTRISSPGTPLLICKQIRQIIRHFFRILKGMLKI